MKNYIYADNLNLQVSRGKIRGASHIHKFGAVYGTASGNFSSVWTPADTGATKLFPWSTSAGTLTLVSSSGDDDSGSSGAQTVTVQGLDDNYNEVSETFTMDGTTPTAAGEVTFGRVNRMFVASGDTNVGKIQAKRSTTVVGEIAVGYGQSLMALYTIPANKKGYLYHFGATASKAQDTTVAMFFRPEGGVFRSRQNMDLHQNNFQVSYDFPVEFDAKTDIDIRVKGSTNADISTHFQLLLIDNDS